MCGLLAKFIEAVPFLRWDIRFVKITQFEKGRHHILVRHEGASYQRVQVPPGKLTVHPGSYPDSGIEQSSC
jgi:hemin uptake protein HemP